jgi:hypothetical protein
MVHIGTAAFAIDRCEAGAKFGFDDARVFRTADDSAYRVGYLAVSPRHVAATPPGERSAPEVEAVYEPSQCKVFENGPDRIRLECGTDPRLLADVRVGACP